MHVAFGRVHRRIAPLRTCFSLMRSGHSEMVLHIHSTQVQIIGEGIVLVVAMVIFIDVFLGKIEEIHLLVLVTRLPNLREKS